MKLLFASILLLLFITTVKPEEEANQAIKIEQIQFSRILPHTYCDQGKSSVQGMYPDSRILSLNRFGYLADWAYCLIAYKENKNIDVIAISGVFTKDAKAFRFETKTQNDRFGYTLLKIAEQISNYKTEAKP
jgi:hypothetical protein